MAKCKICSDKFSPRYSSLEPTCGKPNCVSAYSKILLDKKKDKKVVYKLIAKVSSKRKIQNLQYSADRIVFLNKPENRICPVTGNKTTDVHHRKGRVGDLFLNQEFWLAVSREGHIEIEEHPEWAKEMGYSINRL